jgi:hypothetical protein
MANIALEGMEWSVGRFGARRRDKGGLRCWPAGAARNASAMAGFSPIRT